MKKNKRQRTTVDSFAAYDNKYEITYEDYCLILKTFNVILGEKLLEGQVFTMPHRLGLFSIRKRKTFGKGSFDYQHYKQTGEKVWKKNFHSGGYAGIFDWSIRSPWTDLKGSKRGLFEFKPARAIKRTLASKIKENNSINKYYDID